MDTFRLYQKAYRILREKPAAYVPFFAVALAEFITLSLILVAPRQPFDKVLAPLVSTFWGASYLHYPAHFILLAYLFFLAQVWISILLGSLGTGISVGFLRQSGKRISLEPLLCAFKRYVPLLAVSFCLTALLLLFSRLTVVIAVRAGMNGALTQQTAWLKPALIILRFIITIAIHAFLVYAIPAIIVEKKGFLGSLRRSFGLCRKHLGTTLAMVGVPMLALFPVILFQNRPAYIIDQYFPEAVLLICVVNVLLSSLVIAPLITASATVLLMEEDS